MPNWVFLHSYHASVPAYRLKPILNLKWAEQWLMSHLIALLSHSSLPFSSIYLYRGIMVNISNHLQNWGQNCTCTFWNGQEVQPLHNIGTYRYCVVSHHVEEQGLMGSLDCCIYICTSTDNEGALASQFQGHRLDALSSILHDNLAHFRAACECNLQEGFEPVKDILLLMLVLSLLTVCSSFQDRCGCTGSMYVAMTWRHKSLPDLGEFMLQS